MHWKKVAVQTLLLVVGTVMLCAGALRAEQGNQVMSGVCRNWVRNFQVYHKN